VCTLVEIEQQRGFRGERERRLADARLRVDGHVEPVNGDGVGSSGDFQCHD